MQSDAPQYYSPTRRSLPGIRLGRYRRARSSTNRGRTATVESMRSPEGGSRKGGAVCTESRDTGPGPRRQHSVCQ
eukprot:72454-Rhodomonas_salina.2